MWGNMFGFVIVQVMSYVLKLREITIETDNWKTEKPVEAYKIG